MKKNRNSFFQESSFNSYNQTMNSPFIPPQMNTNQFYQGQMPYNDYTDINERLAKIERQISKLDHRVSKLESAKIQSTDDYDSQNNNMYMI